ncbi:hypothetical protein NQ314_016725 [Rhamnusium bicolor]|uniref:Uncharacterized protein n=1 Tax=Rhamnusium bicolor TaxID=1586634 RepID=A0AAV8WWH0_9CUCU|nr:hypothetical protein NQ314_016725 [Rhamnusium bicolor]
MKNETKSTPNYDEPQPYSSEEGKLHIEAFVVETDFDTKLAAEINEVSAKDMEVLGNLVEENLKALNTTFNSENPTTGTTDNNDRLSSRKRSFDDMEDCDVQDVLSQFYMPPTPMMLTCIDDDEDVNVVDDQPSAKRERVEVSPVEEQCNSYSVTTEMDKISCNFLNKSISAPESRLRYLNNNQNMDTDSNSYSCGHASMLNELQSNVYHNLIASLET